MKTRALQQEGRKARITLSDRQLRSREANGIVKRFRAAFDQTFVERLLPPSGTFPIESQPAYISDREWLASDYERPLGKFPYEALLDDLFWQRQAPITIVVGEVGVGKSTLLHFYLWSYCTSKHPEEFSKKLVVNIDLRNVTTIEMFEDRLYSEMRQAIDRALKERCPKFDIVSDDEYSMWNNRFKNWDSAHHVAMANASKLSVAEYRGACVNGALATITDKDWVQMVLEYLSTLVGRDRAGSSVPVLPFSYIVIVLDNLDQSPYEVHTHAVAVVRSWVTATAPMEFWQIYIPLRPETFFVLQDTLEPLPPHRVVTVGPPDMGKVFDARTRLGLNAIKAQGGSVQVRDDDESDEGQWLTNEQCCDFLTKAFRVSRKDFTLLLNKFASGSIRRLMRLWRCTLSSVSLEQSFRNSAYFNIPRMNEVGLYAWHDGLLTGEYRNHHRTESPIANVYYAVDEPSTCHDLLLGPHMLLILRREETLAGICQVMEELGYNEDSVNKGLGYFESVDLFQYHRIRTGRFLDVRETMLEAHCAMMKEPSYIDNVAPVTPVEPDLLEKIKITRGYNNRDFANRAYSSLAFLEQVERDELSFVKYGDEIGGNSFRNRLQETGLKSVFREACLQYRERLEALKKFPLVSNVQEWDKLVDSPVLRRAERVPTLLFDFQVSSPKAY